MARRIDLTSLTRAERLVLACALAAYANGFVPWWYRAVTPRGAVMYNAGLTGWGVVSVVAAGIAAVAVLARAAIWPQPAPRLDGSVYALLGAVPLAGLAADVSMRTTDWVGAWLGIVLAAATLAAGLIRRRERHAGWL